MSKNLNRIIELDTLNQKRLMKGQINQETFEKEKAKIHDAYLKHCQEQHLLEKLIANKQATEK